MTLSRLDKFPAPYFGGKSGACDLLWAGLGDVHHYVTPFCGSIVDLLRRPHPCNRAYYSETANDKDGLLVNAIRALQLRPQETSEAASWPVTEVDLTARHLAIVRWAAERDVERMMADYEYCDPRIAGWWLWGMSAWIGSDFATGTGPWVVGDDGRITKRQKSGAGVKRKRPHLNNDGKGVNVQTAREPGVSRQLPHLGDNGNGVNTAGAMAYGVAGQPEANDDYREQVERDYAETGGYHPMTMPEVRRWFAFLSARLRHVRVTCGDWRRVLTNGALMTLSVRNKGGYAGVFLDPPYSLDVRADGLYAHDDTGDKKTGLPLAVAVRQWCLENGPRKNVRIVLAGFADEGHEELEAHGWRVAEWFTDGFLTGGYANRNENGHNQHRERLWFSPACLDITPTERADPQLSLFDADADE